MRIIALLFSFALLNGVATAHAESPHPEVYQQALTQILDFESASSFMIWNDTISSERFSSAQVPGQEPERQFSRYMKGVAPSLELNFIYVNLRMRWVGSEVPHMLDTFEMPETSAKFLGFVSSESLRKENNPIVDNKSTLAIGFSQVAYSEDGKKALLYAETCVADQENPICGGTGYLYTRVNTKDVWKLQSHRDMFGGGAFPFWRD